MSGLRHEDARLLEPLDDAGVVVLRRLGQGAGFAGFRLAWPPRRSPALVAHLAAV